MIGKRETSHVWSFFGQMITTILANNLSFALCLLAKLGAKSKKTGISTRATFGSRLFVDHFAAFCVVWPVKTVGESEMQIVNNLQKSFAYGYLCGRTKSAIHFDASITTLRALVERNGKEAEPFRRKQYYLVPQRR
jgi:hypothetical protein